MLYEKRAFTMKNGDTCILRSPTENDAEDMLTYLKQTSSETLFMMRYPDEVTMTREEESAFLRTVNTDKKHLMIAVEADGHIVANGSVAPCGTQDRFLHRALLGISIFKNYWHQGIGGEIMKELIRLAPDMGYEIMELDVVTENKRALELYRRFGFTVCGVDEHAFKYRDNTYADMFRMMRRVP